MAHRLIVAGLPILVLGSLILEEEKESINTIIF